MYWTGFGVQAAVPGGTIGNNNLVWRQLVFTPVTTTKIRVWVTAGLNGYSRVMELEAWGVPAPDPCSSRAFGYGRRSAASSSRHAAIALTTASPKQSTAGAPASSRTIVPAVAPIVTSGPRSIRAACPLQS